MTVIRTICPACGVGCGIRAIPDDGAERALRVDGDRTHPANQGGLCMRGSALGDAIGLEGRLLHPEVGGKRTTWDKAVAMISRRLRDTIARYGPDSVALVTIGPLLTEDHYVANKVMKGFVGSAHIHAYPNMDAHAAAHGASLGGDVVPATYEDVDQADLILLIGADSAVSHPILHQRIVEAREEHGARVVVIDPQQTQSCVGADMHLAIRPGSDAALMNGLLRFCDQGEATDTAFLAQSVAAPEGFWDDLATGHDIWSVARACDVTPAQLKDFYELFAATPRTVTLYGAGLRESDPVQAVLNVHLATGRIGKAGAGPFSLGCHGNSMGAREVGSQAAMLAAHRDFSPDNVAQVRRFWSAPQMAQEPGAASTMDALIGRIGAGEIKALWVMGGSPVEALPDDDPLLMALAQCPFVLLSDSMADTAIGRIAHVRLPAASWEERDGTMTGADRLISRQRAIFPLPGDAKPHWWIVTQVARAIGWWDAFAYDRPVDIYREHARLSAYQNDGARLFDLRRHASMSNPAYNELTPWRWGEVPFDGGQFPTPDGRARLVRIES